jgi:Domain of unknown function (DUF4157)
MTQKASATHKTDAGLAHESGIVLRRKCACGKNTAGGGDCGSCSRKRGQELQRAHEGGATSREGGTASHAGGVPPVVQEVLGSTGRRLDSSTRAFMESRFGHDFSGVKVHTGARAAESAHAVGALAYTVGRDVVFGAGQYAPHTGEGRRLLAHELAHVVQQRPGLAAKGELTLGATDDPAEREADRVADAVLSDRPAAPLAPGPASVIRRAGRDSDSPPPPAPGPSQPSTTATCGPDVTAQVSAAVSNTRSTFGGWNTADKTSACDALDSLLTGASAWDIVELHNQQWILSYRPACATQGATPPCGSTVKVGGDCYYAGSPNYVIYGVMCKLCRDHFAAQGNPSGVSRFTQSSMEYWINFYKGTGFTGFSTPSGNFGPSRAWAIAGYNGWPTGGTPPAGDRNTCAPNCPTPYNGSAFSVRWVPHGTF